MENLKIEYLSRLNELDELLKFINILENNTLYDNTGDKVKYDNSSVINSIKSSFVLAIYNLIEFVIINSILVIEEDFRNHDFGKFTEDFQSIFLKTYGIFLHELSYNGINKKIKKGFLKVLTEDIIKNGYFSENVKLHQKCLLKVRSKDGNPQGISGNINFQTVEILSNFFNLGTCYTKDINGRHDLLDDIKNKRNQLSHGNVSFNFLGKDMTGGQLGLYRTAVNHFLSSYITNIEKYISKKPYLKPI